MVFSYRNTTIEVADGNAARYRSTITPKRSESIVEFLRRGGTVIVTGNAADFLPEHPGRVTFPPETPLAEAVRSACRAPSRNPPAAMRP